jgi:hypothetical protein
MRDWFLKKGLNSPTNIPNCGTAACLAGWAVTYKYAKHKKPAEVWDRYANNDSTWRTFNGDYRMQGGYGVTNVMPEATEILGLTKDQAEKLFMFDNWPKQFKVTEYEGSLEFAQQAVSRIEHFIKTNGEE